MLPIPFDEYLEVIVRGVEAIPLVLRKSMVPLLLQVMRFAKEDPLFTHGSALLLTLEQSARMIEKIRPDVLNLRSIRDAFVFLGDLSSEMLKQVEDVIAKAFAGNGKDGVSLEGFLKEKLGVKTRPRQEIKVKRFLRGKYVKDLSASTFYYLLESLRRESFIVDSPDAGELVAAISWHWRMQGCFPIQDVSTQVYRAVLSTKDGQHFLTRTQRLPDGKNWTVQVDAYKNGN